MKKLSFLGSFIAATTYISAGPDSLQTSGSFMQSPAVYTNQDNDWEFTLGLYAWGAGLDGDIGVAGNVAAVDLSFSDIVRSLDMTASGMMEIRKGKWMFQFDGMYLKNSLGASGVAEDGTQLNVGLTSKFTRLEPIIGYRVFENEMSWIDLTAGISFYDISNTLDVREPAGYGKFKSSDNWVDPIVGFRARHKFNDNWAISVRGDIGGFDVSSDLVWQAAGFIEYSFNETYTAFAGYRHAAVDYNRGGFLYDTAVSGPILGVKINF